MKFLKEYQVAQRISSKFGEPTCKIDGRDKGKSGSLSPGKAVPQKSLAWLIHKCAGCPRWAADAATRAATTPQPLLLCISSSRCIHPDRGIQLAKLRAHATRYRGYWFSRSLSWRLNLPSLKLTPWKFPQTFLGGHKVTIVRHKR